MKKTTLAFLAAAALASCSSDDLIKGDANAAGEVSVQFGLEVPEGIYSRSVNDGTKATNLTVVVFDGNGRFIYQEDRGPVFASGKTQTVNIDLINGQSYIVGFWVDAPVAAGDDDPYTITAGVLTINYDGAKANDDTRDAFYAAKPITVGPTQLVQSITLSRPMAQLNLGTSDYASATENLGKTVTKSTVTVKGCAYASMDLANGTVKGEVVEVTFAMNDLPDYDNGNGPAALSTVSGTQYAWLGMNYVLCDAAGGTVSEIQFDVDDATIAARSYTSGIPVKRNFRSNLLGKLLTTSTGWEVTVDSDFGTGNGQVINLSMWDGQVQMPDIDTTNKTVAINNAQQLAGLAGLVNGTYGSGTNTFEGYTIDLNCDIDLANLPWTPIGSDYQDKVTEQTTVFRGTFKGNDHTISNLAINAKNGGVAENFGLFGNIFIGASISDLTLQNVNIDAYDFNTESSTVAGSCGALAGALFSSASYYSDPTAAGYKIDNVKVQNVNIKAQHYAGGLIGYVVAYGNYRPVDITNCSVDNANITAQTYNHDNGNKVGGLVGQMMTGLDNSSSIAAIKIDRCSVNNATVQGYREVGGLTGVLPVGNPSTVIIYCINNTVSNTTIIQDLSDDYKTSTPTSVGEITGYYLNGPSVIPGPTAGLDLTGTQAVNVTIERK